MFADEIRRAAEAAPRSALDQVASALWRALAAGQVTETEAEAISGLIDARRVVAPPPKPAPRRVGSRPRTDTSMERRRRWAASGRLPPQIAARFTLAEAAVLALVATETCRRGDCRLAVGHLAAIVGVSETTVRNAIRAAAGLGLLKVEERRLTAWRSDTNIVRIISAEWTAWLRLARRGSADAGIPRNRDARKPSSGGGCKSLDPTPTDGSRPVNSGQRNRRKAAEGQGRRVAIAT